MKEREKSCTTIWEKRAKKHGWRVERVPTRRVAIEKGIEDMVEVEAEVEVEVEAEVAITDIVVDIVAVAVAVAAVVAVKAKARVRVRVRVALKARPQKKRRKRKKIKTRANTQVEVPQSTAGARVAARVAVHRENTSHTVVITIIKETVCFQKNCNVECLAANIVLIAVRRG